MRYFNYHTKLKRLIDEGKFIDYEIVDDWNGIKPAFVLYFIDSRSVPTREHMWDEYFKMFKISFK